MELSDFLISYPHSSDPSFQQLISGKEEFRELASLPRESSPGKGKFFRNQIFYHRFLAIYHELLIIDAPGTGKSCSVLGFMIHCYLQRMMVEAGLPPEDEKNSHFKRAIIVCNGPTQINEIRGQLARECSGNRFVVEEKVNGVTTTRILNEEINKFFYFTTYAVFARRIQEEFPDESSRRAMGSKYSDSIFWFDEVHNATIITDGKKLDRRKSRIYATLWTLFHSVRRCKKILSTATPMINATYELISLFNLILPANGELPEDFDLSVLSENDIRVLFPSLPFNYPSLSRQEVAKYFQGQFPSKFDLDRATLADVEPYFRARVGYVRAAETGAIAQEQGTQQSVRLLTPDGKVVETKLTLYSSVMSDFQKESYLRAHASNNDLRQAQRLAANFVFPDGNWGQEVASFDEAFGIDETVETLYLEDKSGKGFPRYVVKNGDSYFPTAEFRSAISTLDKISKYSCKYAAAISAILSCRNGNVFVYDEFVGGSGVITFALCLEAMGFSKFNENFSVFNNGKIRDNFLPYSATGVRRYGLLIGGISTAKFTAMMELMNSYENRHGEYLQVLISSRTGRDGINVSNVLQIHLLGAEWNPSATYQALSRGLRATSHRHLLQEKQAEMQDKGDFSPPFIAVAVYKHTAVATDVVIDDVLGDSSVDFFMYKKSAEKDWSIRAVMRMMKECAVNCQVNYSRNVRSNDIDYSPDCDYQICKYSCFNEAPISIDYDSYDFLYGRESFAQTAERLQELYREKNSYSLDELLNSISSSRPRLLLLVLEKMIREHFLFRDRYGLAYFLREDRGLFYLDPDYLDSEYPSINGYLQSLDPGEIRGTRKKNLLQANNSLLRLDDTGAWEDLLSLSSGDPSLDSILEGMPLERRVRLVEEALVRSLRGDTAEIIQVLLQKYEFSIFLFSEPKEELARVYQQMNSVKVKRGPKAKKTGQVRIKKINQESLQQANISTDETQDPVYLHTLYVSGKTRTNYATTSRLIKADGKLRIYKPTSSGENSGWRDLTVEEIAVYNVLLQYEISKRLEPYRQQELYGIVSDHRLRISDRSRESDRAKRDARLVRGGRFCINWTKIDLIDVMWRLKIPPSNISVAKELSLSSLREKLSEAKGWSFSTSLDKWSRERLEYYYNWYSDPSTNPILCNTIEKKLESEGRIVYT